MYYCLDGWRGGAFAQFRAESDLGGGDNTQGATATNATDTAVGRNASATGGASTAVGDASTASGARSTALGRGSTAGFANSTAIGFAAATTRDDQMVFGTTTNTYTAPGITSAASRAAQTGPRQIVTTDADGNLASDTPAGLGLATMGDFNGLQQQIDRNSEGVAMAMAMTGIPSVLPVDTNYAISANYGTFGGENAAAIGGSARLLENVFFSGGAAFGTGGNNNTAGGRAGVTVAW